MRFSLVALLLRGLSTATLLASVLVAAAPPCDVAMKMRLSGSHKLGPGSTFLAQATLKSTTSRKLTDLYFQFELPAFLVPIKGAVSGHARGGASPFTNQGRRVVFPGLTLFTKKWLKIKLRIGVPQCQALGTVAVGAATYQLDGNGLVTCSTVATPSAVEVVNKRHKVKRAPWDGGDCVVCLDYKQAGSKIIGTGYVRSPAVFQGATASLSDDGRILAVGGYADNNNVGATWLFMREPTGAFTQLGNKLVGSAGAGVGRTGQGLSLAMSGNGKVLVVGGYGTSSNVGGAFIFREVSPGTWQQVSSEPFIGSNPVGNLYENHVSINYDGSVFAVGNSRDDGDKGAAYVFRDQSGNGAYTQWSGKLIGTGSTGNPQQGISVSLDAMGNTLAVGGFDDNSGVGAVWIYKAVNNMWAQVGAKLVGTGASGAANQGFAVALTSDGRMLAEGGKGDAGGVGAIWLWRDLVGDGTFTQWGSKLVGSGYTGAAGQGNALDFSADDQRLVVGGTGNNNNVGAVWIYGPQANGTWAQVAGPLIGTGYVPTGINTQGTGVSLNHDGSLVAAGGQWDDAGLGATWIFDATC